MARQFNRTRPMQKSWLGANFGATSINATAQAVLGAFQFTVSSSSTLLRIRGNLLVKATPDAVADNTVVGLGMGIITTDAATIGGTSVPGPLGDPDWDWVWHQYVPLDAGQAALAGDDIGTFVRVPIDSKAMRKMKTNESLVLIGHAANSNFGALVVSGGMRALFGEF